jgi:hypothetical protein
MSLQPNLLVLCHASQSQKYSCFHCCCCRHCLIVQTKKYLDEMLMDNVLGFLNAQQNSSKPFYMFYAPHSIHT